MADTAVARAAQLLLKRDTPTEFLGDITAANLCFVVGRGNVEAAERIMSPHYAIITLSNWWRPEKADWDKITGKNILLWPSGGPTDRHTMNLIGGLLESQRCKVKALDVSDMPADFDASSCEMVWEAFLPWAREHAKPWAPDPNPPVVATPVDVLPAQAGLHVGVQISVTHEVPDMEGARDAAAFHAIWDRFKIAVTNYGQAIICTENVDRVLKQVPSLSVGIHFDEFLDQVMVHDGKTGYRAWTDEDTSILRDKLAKGFGFLKLGDDMVHTAVKTYALKHRRNAPRDWFDSLIWDHVPRIESFWASHLGSRQDPDYLKAVGRCFWIGMAARIYKPGCKLDTMVLLIGPQGSKKSQAMGAIGGPWHSEMNASVSDKDFFIALTGKLVVEIAELDSFGKAEETRIKQVLSCNTDRYRSPFDRIARDHQRQGVFVGTTNNPYCLKDYTGARRFWPIRHGLIDIEKINAEREQLFAEAVFRYQQDEDWWLVPDALAKAEQEACYQEDSFDDIISSWAIGKETVFPGSTDELAVHDVAENALGIRPDKLDPRMQQRIARSLVRLGYTKVSTKRQGLSIKVWRLDRNLRHDSFQVEATKFSDEPKSDLFPLGALPQEGALGQEPEPGQEPAPYQEGEPEAPV